MITFLRNLLPLTALVAALAMVSSAFWAWQAGPEWLIETQPARPEVMLWAVRSGAMALAGFAQVIVLVWVIGRIYPRRPLDDGLRLFFAFAGALAVVGTVALALAGR